MIALSPPSAVLTRGGQTVEAEELGRRLRVAREARGLSQEAVAEALGLPRTAITQMEAGNRSVSTLELAKLAGLYLQARVVLPAGRPAGRG